MLQRNLIESGTSRVIVAKHIWNKGLMRQLWCRWTDKISTVYKSEAVAEQFIQPSSTSVAEPLATLVCISCCGVDLYAPPMRICPCRIFDLYSSLAGLGNPNQLYPSPMGFWAGCAIDLYLSLWSFATKWCWTHTGFLWILHASIVISVLFPYEYQWTLINLISHQDSF